MTADELLQILIAGESGGRELNFLEDIYYRQLNSTDGAPIDEDEIRELTEEANKLMDEFWEPLPEEHRKAYIAYESAFNHLSRKRVIRTRFENANFRYNFVKSLGNMFNIPCVFDSFYHKICYFQNSENLKVLKAVVFQGGSFQ